MENSDLLRRAEDLQRRCEKNGVLTATHFLTPAERFLLERWAKTQPGCRLVFSGGHPDCERTVGFFLPDWLDEEWLPLDEQICALELSAPFGNPGHREALPSSSACRAWKSTCSPSTKWGATLSGRAR